jgi:hypothetical protein
VSTLRFHSMKLRLEHHHCHRSHSCALFRFFSSCYQLFSFIFSLLGLSFLNLFFPNFFF